MLSKHCSVCVLLIVQRDQCCLFRFSFLSHFPSQVGMSDMGSTKNATPHARPRTAGVRWPYRRHRATVCSSFTLCPVVCVSLYILQGTTVQYIENKPRVLMECISCPRRVKSRSTILYQAGKGQTLGVRATNVALL